ncbi:hypothetical protein LSAT2_025040 [Lamellibrachia satsuma]|nr:hypothetical protein LSAT2_025040 [Lamellibrachia satsuma]
MPRAKLWLWRCSTVCPTAYVLALPYEGEDDDFVVICTNRAVLDVGLLSLHDLRADSLIRPMASSIFLRQTGSTHLSLQLLQREMAAGRIVITLILIAQFAAVAAWTVAGKICVDDCSGRTLGYFQSCDGCGVFAACVWGKLHTYKCPRNKVWDDYWKACLTRSQTCPQVEEYAAVMPGESNSPNVEVGPRRGFGGIASSLFGSAIDLASNLFGGGSKPTSASTPPPYVAAPPYGGQIWPPNAPPNYYPGHWSYPGLGHQPYPRQPLPPSYPPTAPPGQPYDYDYDYVRPSGPEYRPAAPTYDTGPTWPTRPPTAPPTAPPNTRPTWHTNPTVPPRTWAPRPGIIVCNGQEGSRCVRSCVQDGNHQSCHGCNMYVTCNGGIKYDKRPCAANLVWDDNVKTCVYHSTTCKQC